MDHPCLRYVGMKQTTPRPHTPATVQIVTPLAIRVHGEYREMPGLRLTARQAARLFDLDHDVAHAVLDELRCASILARSDDGVFSLI